MKHHLKTLFASILFCAFSAFAQNNSLLWKITGNGLSEPSYLYGSMHISNKLAFHLTDSFFIALKSCEAVAVEINPETWLKGYNDAGVFSQFGRYYGNSGMKDFYSSAFHCSEITKDDLLSAFSENSEMINTILYRNSFGAEDYEEGTFLDLFIYQCGKKLGLQINQMETFEESMKLAEKAYMPDEGADNVSYYKKISEYADKGIDLQAELETAYRNGDLDLIDSLDLILLPSKNMQKYLLVERNKNFIKNMDSLIQLNSMFTAVGVAHLPGDSGMIAMLRQKGYTVTPVLGEVTQKSIKERTRFEELVLPVTFSKHYAADSSFSFETPGVPEVISDFKGNDFSLYADMANGVYYYIQRLPLHNPLFGKSQDDVLQEVDKYLYESIPGTILKREKITGNTGYPGHQVSTKTRKGNIVNYKIFVTPLEVVVFKTGGAASFMETEDAEKFLSSINFKNTDRTTWTTYSPSFGKFALQLPVERITEEYIPETANTSKGTTITKAEAFDADLNYLYFSAAWLPDYSYIEEDTFELRRLADAFYKNKDFHVIDSSFRFQENPVSYNLTLQNENGQYMFVKTLTESSFYYLLAAISNTKQFPEKFFSGFSVSNFIYNKPFEMHTDSVLLYSAEVLSEDTSGNISGLINSMFGSYSGYKNKKDTKEDNTHLPDKKYDVYISSLSPEAIFVESGLTHLFFSSESFETYCSEEIKEIQEDDGFIVKNSNSGNIGDSLYTLDITYADTGSTKAIRIKEFIKGRRIYKLTTVIDTIQPVSEFVTRFYNTFTPRDTMSSKSIFDDKTNLLLAYLKDADTVQRNKALQSFYYVDITDEHTDTLIEYIRSDAYKALQPGMRINLLSRIPKTKQNILPFLEKLYMENIDDPSMQLAILEVLAEQETSAATQKFTDLLKAETPLSFEQYRLNSIFSPFYDSLELAKQLFPSILELTNYEEYEDAVYSLLAELIEVKIIPQKSIEAEKIKLLANATSELKRHNTSSSDNYGSYYYPTAKFYTINELSRYLSSNIYNSVYDAPAIPYFGEDYNYDYYDDYDYEYDVYILDSTEDYTGSTLLDSYNKLLIGWYADAKVKTYFDKLMQNKDENIVFATAVLFLKNNIPVADSVWNKFALKTAWRIPAFTVLKKYSQQEKFPAEAYTQLQLNESLLYEDAYNPKVDSVEYITKRFVETKNGKGFVYFYKSRFHEEDKWTIDCIGFTPADTSLISKDILFRQLGITINKEKTLDEQVNEIVLALNLMGRKRVSTDMDTYDSRQYDDW